MYELGYENSGKQEDFVPLQANEDLKTTIVSDLLGGAEAAVVDLGASLYNSVMPEKYEVSTRDLLSRTNANALRVYEEHPDAVQAASFIGGIFLPTGLALKGMGAARAGMRGTNWFSEAGRIDQMGKVDEMIKAGKMATEEYKVATRGLYLRNAANMVADNAVAELAILGTMNAHPWMEDYVKDPITNFSIGMLAGTALTAPLSHIAARADVKKLGMAAYEEATSTVKGLAKEVELTQDYSLQIAQHQNNINNWENFLSVNGTTDAYNNVTKQLTESFVRSSKAAQVDVFNKMASGELAKIAEENPELRASIMQQISSAPERFAGINSLKFASASEEVDFMKTLYGKLVDSTIGKAGNIPLTTQKLAKGGQSLETVTDDMVFSPTFNAFLRKSDLKGYGVAADIVSSEKALTQSLDKNWHLIPNYDADLEKLSQTSAYLDADYLRKLKAVDEMPESELANMVVHPEDTATLNGLISRMSKMAAEGKDITALKVTLTKEKPNWDKIGEAYAFQEIQRMQRVSAGGTGVKASYATDMATKVDSNWDKFDLMSGGKVSTHAKNMLQRWKAAGSGMTDMRKAVDDAFRPSNFTRHGVPTENITAVKEIYDSAASRALRQELSQLADSEGNIYLYRGLRKDAFSSATVESYTTNAAKAAEFGTPKLYKVKVQDIMGGIRDIPGSAGYGRSTELLVMAHTRDTVSKLPISQMVDALPDAFKSLAHFGIDEKGFKGIEKQSLKNLTANAFDDFVASSPLNDALAKGMTKEDWEATASQYIKAQLDDHVQSIAEYKATKAANTEKQTNSATMSELMATLNATKEADIKMMLNMGIPTEVIQLRTNTPMEAIMHIAGGGSISDVSSRAYADASTVGTYLTPEKKSLIVGTTASKIPVAEMRAQLQTTMMNEVDAGIKQAVLLSSQSPILQDLGAFIFSKDNTIRYQMLKDALAKVTPAALGSRFFSSADFVLRDMGDAGQIIAAMGKDSSHLYDKYTKELVQPISRAFQNIIKDKAAVVEFNTAKEVNASIRGYREFRDGQFFVQDEAVPYLKLPSGEEVKNMVPAKWKGVDFQITSPSVLDAYEQMGRVGREMFEMNSAYRRILGQNALSDMGFWMPAFNPRGKYITYVMDNVDGTTRLLHGNTPQELVSAENAFASTMQNRTQGTWKFVRKGEDQALYNKIEGRHDPMFMSVADINSLHGGSSASAMVSTNTNAFSELANGYEHYIHRSISNHLELQYSDVLAHLDSLSFHEKKLVEGQPVSRIQKALNIVDDAGLAAKNYLLGRSNLKEYVGWQDAQNGMQVMAETGLQAINKMLDPILSPAKGLFNKGKTLSDKEWEQLTIDMEARGIPNPFKDLDNAVAKEKYHVEKISQAPNMTARTVALSNNLAATLLLKVFELGQPLVNMLSLPVLTSAAVQRQFPTTYMGAALKPGFNLSTTRAMYDGIRYMKHPDYAPLAAKAKELGVLTPIISETSELLQMARSFNPGAMQTVENLLNHKMIEFVSKPAIKSEEIVREMSFATGVSLAKKAYPGLSDSGVITFARNFVDTAVGNYNPAQRPTVFQGTIGTAMGLFQTYMVTLAQQIYRKAELRDYKNLMKMMLTQSTLFGAKSLPGFNQVSEVIGEHFSDDHIDLTTGMYRAVPEGAADLILYGMPSNLGPAVYTRGDIQPRIPNIAGGLQNLAAVNLLGQAFDSATHLLKVTQQIGDEGASKAFAEALSIQSLSRPVARLSELVTGHGITRKGNEVSGPEEVYSTQGIMARVFATRSLREAKAREAQYLDSMYKSVDAASRSSAMAQLKGHIRSDTLTPEIVERVQEKYMRTGSPTGWRSAVNTALHDTDSRGVSAVRNHLAPGSPSNMMIEDIDGM